MNGTTAINGVTAREWNNSHKWNQGLDLSEVPADSTVYALRRVLLDQAVVLQKVEHADELREDEHLVSLLLQLPQHLVKQHHLSRVRDHLLERARVSINGATVRQKTAQSSSSA
jgi:hypothetical protein